MPNENYYTFKRESALIKDGDYEAVIEKAEVRTLPTSGKEKLSITFIIRGDVDQPYAQRRVFEDIWKERESPEHFNRRRLNMLLSTQDVKDGTVFETIDDIIGTLIGGFVIIHVATVFDDYRGEDVNKISYYKTSKHKPEAIGAPVAETTKEMEVDDDKLPF